MQAPLAVGHRLIIQTLTPKRNSVVEENLNDLTFIQVRGRSSTYVRQGARLNLRESLHDMGSKQRAGIYDPQGILAVK